MTAAWTIRDGNGQLHAEFAAVSALEVGRRIVPAHFDAFRLHVSPSYREVFDRAVAEGAGPARLADREDARAVP